MTGGFVDVSGWDGFPHDVAYLDPRSVFAIATVGPDQQTNEPPWRVYLWFPGGQIWKSFEDEASAQAELDAWV